MKMTFKNKEDLKIKDNLKNEDDVRKEDSLEMKANTAPPLRTSVVLVIFIKGGLRKIRALSSTIDCYNDKYVGIFPQMFLNLEMFLSIQDTRILMFFQLWVVER